MDTLTDRPTMISGKNVDFAWNRISNFMMSQLLTLYLKASNVPYAAPAVVLKRL